MELKNCTNRTQVYKVAKAMGVTIPAELKKQLTVGGLKDYVARISEEK